MKYSFIIIDDNPESILKTLSVAARFQNLHFLGSASTYDEGLNLVLEHQPAIVFLEINPVRKESNLSILLINELHRFLKVVPKIIITTANKESAFDAFKGGAFNYLMKPVDIHDLRKTILAFEKADATLPIVFSNTRTADKVLPQPESDESIASVNDIQVVHQVLHESEKEEPIQADEITQEEETSNDSETKSIKTFKAPINEPEEKPLIICVKSYGDYRFIEAKDICYLQADNNSTDIHLFNGEMITAFKTLKHFENVLTSPFVRIHNSYIVNIDYVSRIHTGNSVCYIKNTTTKLPFSKSYKENVDAIISSITNGNYLEI